MSIFFFFEGTVAELIRKIPGKATSSNLSRLSRFKQGLMNSQIYRRGHAWSIIYCGLMYLLSSVNVKQDFTSEYPAQMDLLIHVCQKWIDDQALRRQFGAAFISIYVTSLLVFFSTRRTPIRYCYIVIQIHCIRKGRLSTEHSGGPSPGGLGRAYGSYTLQGLLLVV